ncbi:MAG: hypothetical protein LKJ80_05450 [Oscillibacter sp.]|nr:hypothetical protein [Oscillibacter sp.]
MERSRLKNIIIVILALVNAFLIFSLSIRHFSGQAARNRTVSELSALFRNDGVELNTDGLPDTLPPAGGTLTRDLAADKAAAVFLLSDVTDIRNEGGGIYTYSGSGGRATFRSGGSFDASGTLAGTGAETLCRKFCKTFGYEELAFSLDDSGSGTASAVQFFSGRPVINATVTFILENYTLISVSGIHLPSTFSAASGGGSMTAATALTRFLSARRESGAVVSAVTDVQLCYQLQGATASTVLLSPAWQITTDIGYYYVNCSSGLVSRS